MANCFTCGCLVGDFSYTCPSCEGMHGLTELKAQVANAGVGVASGLAVLNAAQREGFARLEETMDRGFSQLASVMEWGFSDLAWRILQQSRVLKSIEQALRSPSEMQANEHRLMADELLARGVLDEAEEFYQKALELNRLDYRVYVSLAEVELRLGRWKAARALLERSLPHAPRNDDDEYITNWQSYSLRLIGRIDACIGCFKSAEACLRSAVELSPNFTEALYDHALYAACIHDVETCTSSLRRSIRQDAKYWEIASRDERFLDCRAIVFQILQRMREKARHRAQLGLRQYYEALLKLRDSLSTCNRQLHDALDEYEGVALNEEASYLSKLERAHRRLKENYHTLQRNLDHYSYRALLDMPNLAAECGEECQQMKRKAEECAWSVMCRVREFNRNRNTWIAVGVIILVAVAVLLVSLVVTAARR